MNTLAHFHFPEDVSADFSDVQGINGVVCAKGLRYVDRNIFESLFLKEPDENGYHAKKRRARRIRAHNYA